MTRLLVFLISDFCPVIHSILVTRAPCQLLKHTGWILPWSLTSALPSARKTLVHLLISLSFYDSFFKVSTQWTPPPPPSPSTCCKFSHESLSNKLVATTRATICLLFLSTKNETVVMRMLLCLFKLKYKLIFFLTDDH